MFVIIPHCRRISDLNGNQSDFPILATSTKWEQVWVQYLSASLSENKSFLLCDSLDVIVQAIKELQYCGGTPELYWTSDGWRFSVSTMFLWWHYLFLGYWCLISLNFPKNCVRTLNLSYNITNLDSCWIFPPTAESGYISFAITSHQILPPSHNRSHSRYGHSF